MAYIGCDLVEIQQLFPEHPLRRERFFNKVFSPAERSLMADETTAEMFWAAKECAYKVHFKQGLRRSFAAGAYTCEKIEEDIDTEGFKYTIKVTYEDQMTTVHAGIFDTYICAFGSDGEDFKPRVFCNRLNSPIEEDCGNLGRKGLNELIANTFNLEFTDYIEDFHQYNYPVLLHQRVPFLEDVSMSHEGNGVFIVVLKKERE